MLSDEAFRALLARVQAGDPDAATELVRQCEPEIRLEVRVRLRVQDGRVRRQFDSMDITQSVLASFFAGVASGRLTPQSPQHLLGLLVAMAKYKLLGRVQYLRRLRRDVRRTQPLEAATARAAPDETPSQIVAGAELVAEFRRRLSDEERQLSERRLLGQSWAAIAAELGGTADGRRKQLERAFVRVTHELGLNEELASVAATQPAGG
jgi:DNA-directed RNA polymerase specialized sigma24 family protein